MNDLRFAFRQLARSPGFTAVALLTLALGIGLNAAMFNVVNALALQPLKLPDAGNLFRLDRVNAQLQSGGHRPAHFVALASACDEFAHLACSRPWSFTLSEPNRPAEVLNAARASAGYFHVLGVQMQLGREFAAVEDVPGRDHVIILSDAYWRSHFGAAADIVGRTVRLDGEPNEIIGVASPLASDPRSLGTPEIYRPLALTTGELEDRVDHAYDIIGRYRPGTTAAEAATRLTAIAAGLAETDPKEYAGFTLRAISLIPDLQGTGRHIVFMLVGLSGFVLLIACANLANLLLARAIARSREFAIRGALGASRAQLIRPLAVECGVLALAGGALGVLVSVWTNHWMARQFAGGGGGLNFVLDWRLLLFAFGASLVTGLLFGVAPAWLVSHVRINAALQGGTRGSSDGRSQHRLRQALIAAQFALALVLLSGAGYFARGLDALLQRDAGWNPAPVLRGILAMPGTRYPDTASMMRFYEQVQERVAALPGVAAAAVSHEVPAFFFPSGRAFVVEGQPPAEPGNAPGAPINGVTPGYFDTLGTQLLRGRDFTRADQADSPRVIILNETMARTLFPDEEAVGRHLSYFDESEPRWMEIVGVVKDVQFINLGRTGASFQAYVPLSQATWSYVALLVRAAAPPTTLIDSIRRAVNELDPDMAVKELMPVPAFIERNLRNIQLINQLLVAFAVLGLFLAGLGIYGVIARLVAQRTHEIGVRMALGAQAGNIARLVLGAGLRMGLLGSAIGLVGSILLAQFLASSMPGIAGGGGAAITGAAVVLIVIALIACWLPARRATKVDPLVALRAE